MNNIIKQLIQKFRINTDPEDYCECCPFIVKSKFGYRYMCSYCSEIFKMTPPKSDKLEFAYISPCPCSLYGEKYVSKKIKEFMNE